MRRRPWLVVSAALLVAFGPPGGVRGETRDVSAAELAEATRVRAELGFDVDAGRVKAILAAHAPGIRGGHFTKAEQVELDRREEVLDRLGPAVRFLDENKDLFGGLYFDQSRGDMLLVVNLPSGTTDATRARLDRLIPRDARVEYRATPRTQSFLESLRDELYFGLPDDRAKTAHVDPRQGKVILAVGRENLTLARRLIEPHAGDVVLEVGGDIVGDACVSRSSCEVPWRGGTFLSGCTWGFNARPTVNSSTRWVIGGGHCNLLGDDLIHDGAVVNTAVGVDRNTFDMASKTSESMRAPLQVDAGARNLVYISNGNMAYAITASAAAGDQQVGVGIAQSGRSSLYVEGTIQAINLLASVCRFDGKCYTVQLNRATFSAASGDSGGPIIHRTLPKAFGILYGHCDGCVPVDTRALYSPINRVLADMSARLCLNATCS